MAARVKKRADTSTNRESDKIIVRLPSGMRGTIAKLAAEHGRSMNAEVVDALARYTEFARAKDEDRVLMLSEVGLSQISKRLLAGVDWLEKILFEVRDVDLDGFMADQRAQGLNLTRAEAIRKILRAYLEERGYVRGSERKNPPA